MNESKEISFINLWAKHLLWTAFHQNFSFIITNNEYEIKH